MIVEDMRRDHDVVRLASLISAGKDVEDFEEVRARLNSWLIAPLTAPDREQAELRAVLGLGRE